jgi:glutamate synthase (NADPH/NADH) large chain
MDGLYHQQGGLYRKEFEHDSCGVGFVAHIKGKKSHDIIKRGIEILERMEHRGAEGADNKTGDGAGIMIQIPHDFYREVSGPLPEPGRYGTGLVFLPPGETACRACTDELERIVRAEGQTLIAWRDVPVDNSGIGEIALSSEPLIKQLFIQAAEGLDGDAFERRLYMIRKLAERALRQSDIPGSEYFYLPSLSSKTMVYKGMFMPTQVKSYYADLADDRMKSAIALVHSRFSTNTFPSWDLAQPFRIIAHNGEINTVKGNRFWMQAREPLFSSELFGDDMQKILPVIEPGKSDSASFDNAVELLVAAGRSLPHALMMLIPESWNDKNPIPDDLKKFYEYHSTFMEPWDGPASMVFCDGRFVGGTLDRNGLRPSRYIITRDDLIVMGSEVGVQDFAPEEVRVKGRLMPGKILLVDTDEGRIIPDEEIKHGIAHAKPYRQWVEENRMLIADMPGGENAAIAIEPAKLHELHLMHGYSREDIDEIIVTMAATGQEATGSMGTDTPLAVFSDMPQPLFNYFKQCFAQVTNPAIDPIREELVMTLTSYIGKQRNLLDETSLHCRMVKFTRPLFTNAEMEKIKNCGIPEFRAATVDMVFSAVSGPGAWNNGLKKSSPKSKDTSKTAQRSSCCRTAPLTRIMPPSPRCWPAPPCTTISFASSSGRPWA